MSKLDAEGLQDAIDEISASILQVRNYKNEHPELKVGFYEGSVGGLLNAYREGDLSFDECTERLIPRAAVAAALAELRTTLNGEIAYCSDDDCDYDEGVQFAMTKLDETIAKLGLEEAK